MMDKEIDRFIEYMIEVKEISDNTRMSYRRDLKQLMTFLTERGISDWNKTTRTVLNSYVLYLEKKGRATSSISRMLASIKAFYHYEFRNGKIADDPAELIKAPKVEKKVPVILSKEEVELLLRQPTGRNAKELRDKAMLELLYATGIRVSELISLNMEDVNMSVGYINCHDGHKERLIPFGKVAMSAMNDYLETARKIILKGKESSRLFTNCNGESMTRQGFWKIIKYYAGKSGIEADITPYTLRHSFAAHLLGQGADVHALQTILGHADSTTTQIYYKFRQDKLIAAK